MSTQEWVVIPAYNEAGRIGGVLEKVKKHAQNVIVVDDGSRDKTSHEAEEHAVIALRHAVNLGKGAALKTGCDYAVKNGALRMVVLDADAQHNPEHIPAFFSALAHHDIVFSYRKRTKAMPAVLRFGNWFISSAATLLYGIRLRDTQCGYRAFTEGAYKRIRWSASDYSMESEMIANAGKQKLRYAELPIETIYADRYKGTTILDGIKIVINMLWWRLTR
ncbi:TPA: glycosyltransferase family 2 protein [Candidatus Woesearchaeota archaeon]|nr:glycosyltransferase family 2 protein [Candidatus Woesearchaeota archaeon]HII68528.1 glycosyltransferase family 2 protein [Candidatus Woesearchaeota archaeon]